MHKLNVNQWVNEYADQLYRYALPRVEDAEIAKDLVQDTFLSAWRNAENFKGEASEKNWLYTILKNKIIDHYRKASTRKEERFSENQSEEYYFNEDGHWTETASPNEWGVNYNEKINQNEFYEVLEKCKKKLKEIQNAVFSMKYLEGLESEEICKELNLTSSNYWVLLHRAKVQLRACLEKNWFI